MNITQIIKQNNLYPQDIQTYVQPFSDGSDFFWNKVPSFTQFVNDQHGKLEMFFKSIRQNKPLEKDSIYFEHQNYEKNISVETIRNSDFFKRLTNTYLFCRTYDRTILSTDSQKTFYLCLIQPTQQILDDFQKIKGKFLFIYQGKDLPLKYTGNWYSYQDVYCLFNYFPAKEYDLFNI